MKQTDDFLKYCKKQKKNAEGYNCIVKKIHSLNKKTKLNYKMLCKVNLNKSIKNESISKNVLTGIAIFITLMTLSFSVDNVVNTILDTRMSEHIEILKRDNEEARNIINNIKNGSQEDRILQIFTYNQNSGEWEYGATKSEIDYYNDNIEDNNKFINSNNNFQLQQYSPMYIAISFMSIFMICIIISLYCHTNETEFYKNLVDLLDLY